MKRATNARLLAALMLLPLLAGAAAGAPPTPTAGSPHDPIAEVTAIAIAPDGNAAAATMGAPFFRGSGAQTTCAPTDFQVYNFSEGATYRGTFNSFPAQSGCREPLGRSHVAMSHTGLVIATLGRDHPQSNPLSNVLELTYHRIEAPRTWNTTVAPQVLTVVLPGTAVGLEVSADGNRVVVAGNDASGHYVRGYTYGGNALNLAFTYTNTGDATALASSADLGATVVASKVNESGVVRGGVFLIPFSEGRATHAYYDRTSANSTVRILGMSPDGTRYVAGGANGTLLAFENRGGLTVDPVRVATGEGNVTHLAVSGDGSRLAVATGRNLTHYDYSAAVPTRIWNYTAVGDGFTSLAYNRTGGLLFAGIVGLGAVGFGETNATPFWTIPGANTLVDVNQAGTRALVAQRAGGTTTTVSLLNLTRAIQAVYPGGAKESVPTPVVAGAPAAFELELTNTGAAPEQVVFDVQANVSESWTVSSPRPTLAAGETRRVEVLVTPRGSEPGDHTFNITARALTSEAKDNFTVTVRVQARVNVTLAYDGPRDVALLPGATATLLLGVKNEGNKDTAVGIRATQSLSKGENWNISVDPLSFTLPPNTITTARVTIRPPAEVSNGTANTVTFTLEGQDVSGTVNVTFRVNPQVGVSVEALGRARFVEPGRFVTYNVTVMNNGTLPRDYDVFHTVTSSDGRAWNVEYERGPYMLVPGASESIRVRVYAPADADNDDRATVVFTARSIPQLPNETAVESNVTLFANAAPIPTPTVTEEGPLGIPAPGAVLTTLLLAGIALRRRQSR